MIFIILFIYLYIKWDWPNIGILVKYKKNAKIRDIRLYANFLYIKKPVSLKLTQQIIVMLNNKYTKNRQNQIKKDGSLLTDFII